MLLASAAYREKKEKLFSTKILLFNYYSAAWMVACSVDGHALHWFALPSFRQAVGFFAHGSVLRAGWFAASHCIALTRRRAGPPMFFLPARLPFGCP